MVYEKTITGKYVLLRSIEEGDAKFSLEIRQDINKTKFLHKVENDINKQIQWIIKQRNTAGDYFFIVETLSGQKIGTVSIYEIQNDTAHLGRLLMLGNPFQTFEATLLACKFAFDILKLEKLNGDVDVENTASINLSEAMGMHFDKPVYENATNSPVRYVKYGTIYKSEFSVHANNIERLIYRD